MSRDPVDRDDTKQDGVRIHIPRIVAFLLCFLLPVSILTVGLVSFWLGWYARRVSPGSTVAVQTAPLKTDKTTRYMAKPGPWGDLECIPIFIEIPDEYLSVQAHEADEPRWFFGGSKPQTLTNLFEGAGLSAQQRSDLMDATKWEVLPSGIYLKPSTETVLSLSPDTRGKLYSVLGQFDENAAQAQPFSWSEKSANLFCASADVAASTRVLVRKLCYRRGKQVLFADLPVVLRKLSSDTEKRRLEKALSRQPTLLVRLVLDANTDVPALLKYWGRAGYGKDLEPILRAAANAPGGIRLSILNLLPPWPTARLYSFPFPTAGAQYNCHWTSFNFFKDVPDPPTNDGSYWKHKLDVEYYPVISDPRFGDIVMLERRGGEAIHSCVFIADNIVYTKNGASPTVPWVLMTMPNLLEYYASEVPTDETLRVGYYRNKNY
jgi:hypothetical protein